MKPIGLSFVSYRDLTTWAVTPTSRPIWAEPIVTLLQKVIKPAADAASETEPEESCDMAYLLVF